MNNFSISFQKSFINFSLLAHDKSFKPLYYVTYNQFVWSCMNWIYDVLFFLLLCTNLNFESFDDFFNNALDCISSDNLLLHSQSQSTVLMYAILSLSTFPLVFGRNWPCNLFPCQHSFCVFTTLFLIFTLFFLYI